MKKLLFLLCLLCNLSAHAQWYGYHNGTGLSVVAGATIPNNRFIYIKQSDGKAYLADPSDRDKSGVALVVTGGASGDTLFCYFNGQHYWPYGQIKTGTPYYLDAGGAITRVRPVHPIQVVAMGLLDSLISIDLKEMYAGIIDTSATLDFGSVSASGTDTRTITATGAEIGDGVLLAVDPASEVDNTIYKAKVTAADTVTVTFFNLDAGPINPPSGVFRVKIFKML